MRKRKKPTVLGPVRPLRPMLPGVTRFAREAERIRKFGPDACCVLCRESDLNVLEFPNQTILQEHHAMGRHHDVRVATPVCPTCHVKLHVEARNNQVILTRQRSLFETLVSVLRGLAVLFTALGTSLLQFAEKLAAQIVRLDAWQPGWRTQLGGAA